MGESWCLRGTLTGSSLLWQLTAQPPQDANKKAMKAFAKAQKSQFGCVHLHVAVRKFCDLVVTSR